MKKTLLVLALGVIVFSGCKRESVSPKFNLKGIERNLPASEVDFPITSIAASSSISGWPASNAIDGNIGTSWSSITKSSNHTESINFHFSGFNNVNFVKLIPRFNHGPALGFPVNFSVYYSNGSSWILSYTYTNFPTPTNTGDHSYPVILPLSTTVNTNGIQIIATQLGKDDVNNYVFQLAEVVAGYNADFEHFKFNGNDGSALVNRIYNAGSGTFNPSKLTNWTEDERYPLIYANVNYTLQNIYAPSIVKNGIAWNIYYGGWDAVTQQQDNIYVTVTLDNFSTFGTHTKIIDHGAMVHVNNESVFKKPNGTWLMNYTNLPSGNYNKPGYATSSDGVSWTPSAGTSSNLLNITGYTLSANPDINGSNVVYLDNNGVYHLYFTDFNATYLRIHHATSTDNINYTYLNDTNAGDGYICNDLKPFTYNGTTYYLMGMHNNSPAARSSVSTSLTTFPNSTILFPKFGATDNYITSIGFVAADNRLYGALYGASSVISMDKNAIYAYWLTKKIIFVSDETGLSWGNPERSHGPEQVVLPMDRTFNTGHFNVYDSDGTTLLFTSPQVTIRSGDTWNYIN